MATGYIVVEDFHYNLVNGIITMALVVQTLRIHIIPRTQWTITLESAPQEHSNLSRKEKDQSQTASDSTATFKDNIQYTTSIYIATPEVMTQIIEVYV